MKNIKKLHIFIIVVGAIFVSLGVFHSNLWFDECYSVGMASKSFGEIWSIGSHDVHPVFYYFILHIIYLLTNNSFLAYRLFSAIIIILTGILGFTHIRKDFGEKTGLIFSFLIYFSPVSSVYAGEIRMYSLAMFLITIVGIYAYRLANKSKVSYWIIFWIACLASIYTHYYALMAAGIINIVLLIYFIKSKKKKSYLIQIWLGVSLLILYLPWIISFLSQLKTMSSNGFWITITFPKTLIEILGFQFYGNLNMYVGFIVAILIYGYAIYLLFKTKNNNPAILAIIVCVLVIAAAGIISLVLGTAILYYRYVFVVTGLCFFGLSYLFSKGKTKYTIIICSVILVLGIVNNYTLIKENYDSSNQEPIEFLKENIEEGDVIVTPNIGVGSVISVNFPEYEKCFYNKSNWGVEEAYKAFGPNFETYITTDFLEKCNGRIWILTSGSTTLYDTYFDNENYELILTQTFETAYEDYYFQFYLVEYIGDF